MPVYGYVGTDKGGKSVQGTISADSPRAGRDSLRDQGIQPQTLNAMQEGSDLSLWQQIGLQRAKHQWGGVAHEISMLLRAGISIDEAIETLANQYRGAFHEALTRLHDQVSAGRSLADAMSDQPIIFDAASIRLVEVGENAGTLEVVLEELAEFKRRMSEFGDKIVSALMYPLFLFLFGTAAMIFLMTWVLPPLLENLQETLVEIPWPTRVAKFASDVLVAHGGKLFLVGVGILIGGLIWFRRPQGRYWLHEKALRFPVIGPLLTKQHVARSSMILGLLLRSGIPLNQAVDLAARSSQNEVMKECLQQCGADLAAGRDLAASLSKYGIFPPLAVRVFSVGQDSGQLDDMLIRLGQDYNQQVQVASARLTTLLEPIMILIMAVLVGFLLVATILPILQAGQMV